MTSTTFDTLGYFEKLKAAGVPESQAKVQVEVMQDVVRSYDDASRKDIATRGDLQEITNRIAETKFEILKWMVGIAVAQIAVSVALFAIK